MKTFVKRIPAWNQITPVYAVIAVMLYTWSLILFFWRMTSWTYFSPLGEIGVIFSYMVVVDLIDSVLVLLALVFLSMVLPRSWLHDRFVSRGSLLVLLGLGYLMYFNDSLWVDILAAREMLQRFLLVALVIIVLVWLIDRVDLLRKLVEDFANRVIVFLYVFMPVSAVSLFTVLIRNIF
jgi:hypothetical protein